MPPFAGYVVIVRNTVLCLITRHRYFYVLLLYCYCVNATLTSFVSSELFNEIGIMKQIKMFKFAI